ncbi:hypothetical protein Ct9H90mP29_22140 [bacterium]|nr:MAG: hypothetical protein Ct9H90mP29_22140 [bacterium]
MFEGDPGNTMYEFLDGFKIYILLRRENGCDSLIGIHWIPVMPFLP